MERTSQVLEIEINHEGSPHRASYFIENETIYASIGGRMLIAPTGPRPAADTVKTLLSGHLLQQSRKLRHMGRWNKG
ncbi:MAG: hypothetical protein WBA73_07840 [Devosia sp.]